MSGDCTLQILVPGVCTLPGRPLKHLALYQFKQGDRPVLPVRQNKMPHIFVKLIVTLALGVKDDETAGKIRQEESDIQCFVS